MTVTVVEPDAAGFVAVGAGTDLTTSNVNVVAGDIVANAVTVTLPATGAADVVFNAFDMPGPTTDILVGINGDYVHHNSMPQLTGTTNGRLDELRRRSSRPCASTWRHRLIRRALDRTAELACGRSGSTGPVGDGAMCVRRGTRVHEAEGFSFDSADHDSHDAYVQRSETAMNTHEPLSGGIRRAEGAGQVQSKPTDDEHGRVADEREATLVERDSRTTSHEAGIDDRAKETEAILADAATRDDLADERDAVADERERVTSLDAFLHPDADHYDTVIKALRAAAIDRAEAKSDRSSSANDRSKLGHG